MLFECRVRFDSISSNVTFKVVRVIEWFSLSLSLSIQATPTTDDMNYTQLFSFRQFVTKFPVEKSKNNLKSLNFIDISKETSICRNILMLHLIRQ